MRSVISAACVSALLIGCSSEKSTSELIEQLRSADTSLRLHALRSLEDRSAEANVIVPALAGALRDNDVFVRRDAVRALGKMGPAATPLLAQVTLLLQDPNAGIRKAAARALKLIDPEKRGG